ncbi:XRE family transcriptional regulator [Gloeocapsa sp. PCC 73106]|uniref:XRE family transcriptional regulator n=1 Tax=Gloeocapsa sp. PCC 73106 TaxID=102232 RepID=UPI0002ABD06D|nr:XRE family transcriptional regulator [Gloeocapsa sp. PCC 73106]ELR97067.1 Helix-turn-helix protein [Gloeocapsa sp. PCC 73106]
MAKKLDQIIQNLPEERQRNIDTRASELIAEHMTLRDIRKARELTQESMAELLEIGQDSVSRLEKRTDLLLSTLRSHIKAMGGELELTVKFPDRPTVILTGLYELDEDSN